MIKFEYTPRFKSHHKKYIKHSNINKEAVKKALRFFIDNPIHPSLHIEKLQGIDMWSIRLSKGDRLFFTWIDNETALLLDIGKHDKYRTVS